MTTRDDLLHRLKEASIRGPLRTVVDDAIGLITKSAICEVKATGSRQSAAHYAFVYQRRADNPNPAVRAIPGLLASLENFKSESGSLEMIACSLDSRSIATWFSENGEIVGCMLLGSARA